MTDVDKEHGLPGLKDLPGGQLGSGAPQFDPQQVQRDLWAHRSDGMRCHTCMWYVSKNNIANTISKTGPKGRCRRHAPTMSGYPVVFPNDWCGDHKLS